MNYLSKTPVLITIYNGENTIGTANGLFYKRHNSLFFITNYHVIKGTNPLNGHLEGIPSKISIAYFLNNHSEKVIKNIDNLDDFKFHTNSKNEKYYDIAIIRVNYDDVCTANNFEIQDDITELYEYNLEPAQRLFIIGYFKDIGLENSPIWKYSTIACEPSVSKYENNYFYVDTKTRQGLSGSPVYAYFLDNDNIVLPNGSIQMCTGKHAYFVGIYSGRDKDDDDYTTQLGIIWPKSEIDAIIDQEFFSYTFNS